MFYAPWCPHCQDFAPQWSEAAEKLKRYDMVLGRADCTNNEDLSDRFMVRKYPTFKWFHKSKTKIDYDPEDSPTSGSVVSWVNLESSWYRVVLEETEVKVSLIVKILPNISLMVVAIFVFLHLINLL